MHLDSIKIIFLLITILLILTLLFSNRKFYDRKLKFLLSSLAVSLILLFTIVLKLHHLLRSEFGIPNSLTYTLVLIPFLFHFYQFKFEIIRTNFVLLILSICFISSAVILDLLTDGKIIELPDSDIKEEFLRIVGTGLWMLYYIKYSLKFRNIQDVRIK